MNRIAHQNIITKANSLIMSRYNLSLAEQRLIIEVASMISPQDEDFVSYDVLVKDYVSLVDSTAKNEYRRMKDLAETLLKKPLFIKNEDGGFTGLNWFSSLRYIPKDGVLRCKFDSDLRPYLLKLKECFTSYQLENILKLRSKYAVRLYEILKSKVKLKVWQIELDEFRQMVAIPESYKWDDIKKRVLQESKKALKATDIRFDFKPVKRGRRVAGVKFSIMSTRQQSLELGLPDRPVPEPEKSDPGVSVRDNSNQEIDELLDLVPADSKKRVIKLIRELITEYGPDYTREKILLANEANAKEKLKNYAGWLRRAIERDFEAPEQKEKEKLPPNRQFFLLPEQEQEKWIKRVAEHPAVVDLPKNTAARRGEQVRQAIKFWWKNR